MIWLTALLGLVDPISRIAGKIADARIAATNATTDKEKIAADERVKGLEVKRDVMVAEAGSKLNAVMRAAYGIPPAIYLAKLFVYDKVLGFGTTDPISPMMENVLWTVVGFYFLHHTARMLRR
jgi:hypothetical protein